MGYPSFFFEQDQEGGWQVVPSRSNVRAEATGPTVASGRDALSSEIAGISVSASLFQFHALGKAEVGTEGSLSTRKARGVGEQTKPGSWGRVSRLEQSCQQAGVEGHLSLWPLNLLCK